LVIYNVCEIKLKSGIDQDIGLQFFGVIIITALLFYIWMMKKKFFVLLLLISLKGPVRGQHVLPLKVDDLSAFADTCASHVLVINFWATFCKPCVEEIPHFISIAKSYAAKDVTLLFVSVDGADVYPEKLRQFIQKRKWRANFAWLDETDASYFCPKIDPAWGGSIPATLIVNTKKKSRHFIEDAMSAAVLKEKINTELLKKF
jgi:thiol-disulfide isomerase/thioredoxin